MTTGPDHPGYELAATLAVGEGAVSAGGSPPVAPTPPLPPAQGLSGARAALRHRNRSTGNEPQGGSDPGGRGLGDSALEPSAWGGGGARVPPPEPRGRLREECPRFGVDIASNHASISSFPRSEVRQERGAGCHFERGWDRDGEFFIRAAPRDWDMGISGGSMGHLSPSSPARRTRDAARGPRRHWALEPDPPPRGPRAPPPPPTPGNPRRRCGRPRASGWGG